MTSVNRPASTHSTQQPHARHASAAAAAASPSRTTSPATGAVPAQLPVRSYATATKTASHAAPPPAGASSAAQHAASAASPVNGTTPTAPAPAPSQGGSQPNGTATTPASAPTSADHSRKTSVVINASGASGQMPNGGPVGQNGRPPINFGSMGAAAAGAGPPGGSPLPPPSAPYAASQPAASGGGLHAQPPRDPRVISPNHSPSPIPQPPASGGRPPSLQSQSNNMTFGQLGGESDPMRPNPQLPLGPGMASMHERRASSHSMHSDASNQGMNMGRPYPPPTGRGRGYAPQPPFGQAPSPAAGYRPLANQPGRPNMPPQFQPPNSPYGRGRGSPAIQHAQPHMPHAQMGYGYPPNMPQGMYSQFNPYEGHWQPYGYPQSYYPGQPPQSPRPPPYPSPYNAPQAPMQPPFHPPDMSRSASQSSQRPPSSLGQHTPAVTQPTPASQTSTLAQTPAAAPTAQFVRPKKSSAIKITDSEGNEVNFNRASPTPSAQAPPPPTPVIVSTPNAPTPRAPSAQHNRTESKSTKSPEETKNAFQEQVKRQVEEEKRKEREEEEAKAKAEKEKDEGASKATPERESAEKPAAATSPTETPAEADKPAPASASTSTPAPAAAPAAAPASAAAPTPDAKPAPETAPEKSDGDKAEKEEKEETEEERIEREIAEMEAAEREEEERERAFQEKRKREKEAEAKRQAEKDADADAELKRQEREAEAREEARERERKEREAGEQKTEVAEDDAGKSLFASLKKPTLGPGAEAATSGTETPASEATSEDAAAPSAAPSASQSPPAQAKHLSAQKPKPAHLKLETTKRVEPAEPTPGMQALKSARFLELKDEAKYPGDFKSPNPALSARKGRAYDKDFLLQFQSVFKEKPSVDWDQKVKETLGSDEPGTGRPQSARTPAGMSRQPSGRPGAQASQFGVMGQFSGPPGGRTLPPGTTSQERFAASQMGGGRGPMAAPNQMGRLPSNLGMGAPGMGMSRTNSLQAMAVGGPGSPRQASSRGAKGGSRRGDRTMSKKEEAELASKMPLTAHMEIKGLEKSMTGWKPTSIGQTSLASGPDLSGNMTPDLVQRKVKAALNKMTPEKFDKISDQILEIASQSKNESDGRTLRQVIQLTFEKACDEAHWAGMYAQFCHKMLTAMSPEIGDETIKDKNGNPVVGGALFRKYLLNRCQEEFERGWQVNLPDKPEGDTKEAAVLSDEYYIAATAKRRGLGLIQFIGQLYKLRMLTLRIMHECVMKLLNFEGDPDEAAVENLTTLLRTVGATMNEEDQGRQMLAMYFQRIDDAILKSDALGSRPKFMIMDLMDLRRSGWRSKDDAKGPKTLEQIHQEAAAAQAKADAERQRQSQRGGPGGRSGGGRDGRNFSGGMPQPVDYNRTTVGMDDLRRLQQRGASRASGGGLGPGGSLGPGGGLGGRTGSRRSNLGPSSSGNTTRTNTPPVDKDKKDESNTQQNAFSALASLDQSGDTAEHAEAASSSAARNRSKSPLAAKAEKAS